MIQILLQLFTQGLIVHKGLFESVVGHALLHFSSHLNNVFDNLFLVTMSHFVNDLLFKSWDSEDLIRNLIFQGPVLLAGRTLTFKHVILESVVGPVILGAVSEVDRVALSDLLAHGDVVGGHQDGALVDIAPR